MNKSEIIAIIEKYSNGLLSADEEVLLHDWAKSVSPDEFHQMLDECEILPASLNDYQVISPEFARKLEALLNDLDSQDEKEKSVLSYGSLNWKKWIAAAAILVAVATSSYFLFFNKPQKDLAQTNSLQVHDIKAPATNNAIITLSNGKEIILDSAGIGMLAMQGNLKVVKLADGQVAYNGDAHGNSEVMYNTLTNPRGSKVVTLTLNDGTKVWLNNESSLRYPTAFASSERKVEITGEAYFEVKHHSKMPFKVKAGNETIEDIGTSFNINAYTDEPLVKTTLIEGSVKFNDLVLKRGQQGISANNTTTLSNNVNMEEVVAWKEGLFHFESADLKTILTQYSRWYDVDVTYDGTVTDRKFFVIVKRSSTLKDVLQMLQDNNIIYRIKGKKLIVKST